MVFFGSTSKSRSKSKSAKGIIELLDKIFDKKTNNTIETRSAKQAKRDLKALLKWDEKAKKTPSESTALLRKDDFDVNELVNVGRSEKITALSYALDIAYYNSDANEFVLALLNNPNTDVNKYDMDDRFYYSDQFPLAKAAHCDADILEAYLMHDSFTVDGFLTPFRSYVSNAGTIGFFLDEEEEEVNFIDGVTCWNMEDITELFDVEKDAPQYKRLEKTGIFKTMREVVEASDDAILKLMLDIFHEKKDISELETLLSTEDFNDNAFEIKEFSTVNKFTALYFALDLASAEEDSEANDIVLALLNNPKIDINQCMVTNSPLSSQFKGEDLTHPLDIAVECDIYILEAFLEHKDFDVDVYMEYFRDDISYIAQMDDVVALKDHETFLKKRQERPFGVGDIEAPQYKLLEQTGIIGKMKEAVKAELDSLKPKQPSTGPGGMGGPGGK